MIDNIASFKPRIPDLCLRLVFCPGFVTWCLGLFFPVALWADKQTPPADVIIVQGASGTEAFGEMFQTWADRWVAAAKSAGIETIVIGREASGDLTDRDRLRQQLAELKHAPVRPLWLVLIGHGTFDRRAARFNLRGPDVSADDLSGWLNALERPQAIVDCSAASAPFLTVLSRRGRIVLTATKTGGEENFSRFGDFLSQAMTDPAADLDKDDQTSLWEAYLAASRQTAEYYTGEGRLQTEHALLDDNGDQQGTRADLFHGLLVKDGLSVANPLDGSVAHQWHLVPSARDSQLPVEVRRRRDDLELEIVALRAQKAKWTPDEYYGKLERLLVELARLNQ